MLGRHYEPGGSCARLGRASGVVAVQEVVESRRVRRMSRRARIPWLLEIEDARLLEILEKAQSRYR